MLITCTNKGCLQTTEAQLDKSTNEVICMTCGKPISNITEQMKRTLVAFGQVRRSAENKPFQVRCPTCAAPKEFTLSEGVAHCVTCGTELHMSAAFLRAFKECQEKKNNKQDK